ncbi:hypothetical protein PR048_026238 [Dryococelus australis]|uniref:Uncharacterized protein n=1 Tax=Dryococelus australis TaxID=614101 RepID=A0ABQ9GKS2_9NEOP|nr:hypothetical protein PR048_026238 [Dryococelus australis]
MPPQQDCALYQWAAVHPVVGTIRSRAAQVQGHASQSSRWSQWLPKTPRPTGYCLANPYRMSSGGVINGAKVTNIVAEENGSGWTARKPEVKRANNHIEVSSTESGTYQRSDAAHMKGLLPMVVDRTILRKKSQLYQIITELCLDNAWCPGPFVLLHVCSDDVPFTGGIGSNMSITPPTTPALAWYLASEPICTTSVVLPGVDASQVQRIHITRTFEVRDIPSRQSLNTTALVPHYLFLAGVHLIENMRTCWETVLGAEIAISHAFTQHTVLKCSSLVFLLRHPCRGGLGYALSSTKWSGFDSRRGSHPGFSHVETWRTLPLTGGFLGVLPLLRGSGHPRNIRILNVEEVLNVGKTPSTSTRSIAQGMGVSHSAVWRLMHEQLLCAFHVRKVQALGPAEFAPRLVPHVTSIALFVDEVIFTRDAGIVTCRTAPILMQLPSQSTSTDVLRITGRGIVGDHFLGPPRDELLKLVSRTRRKGNFPVHKTEYLVSTSNVLKPKVSFIVVRLKAPGLFPMLRFWEARKLRLHGARFQSS